MWVYVNPSIDLHVYGNHGFDPRSIYRTEKYSEWNKLFPGTIPDILQVLTAATPSAPRKTQSSKRSFLTPCFDIWYGFLQTWNRAETRNENVKYDKNKCLTPGFSSLLQTSTCILPDAWWIHNVDVILHKKSVLWFVFTIVQNHTKNSDVVVYIFS